MNVRFFLVSALEKIAADVDTLHDFVARREMTECKDALEYAIWCFDNAHAIESKDISKSVYRIFPEFYLVARAEALHKDLRKFGDWQLDQARNI